MRYTTYITQREEDEHIMLARWIGKWREQQKKDKRDGENNDINIRH